MITKREIMERICRIEDMIDVLTDEVKAVAKPKKPAKKTTKKAIKKDAKVQK